MKYEDLSAAFDCVSFAAPMEHQAYISIDTGTIYWISELNPLEEEAPEDQETSSMSPNVGCAHCGTPY